ncbi:DUF4097 family beta strand repeat-containing protein [Agromyces tropicus]|uniref:DUF4097 family beta strand repeat-containing protein n=1 Tax=Agromyces tropicus TaxID=555371 RepID=A0ABN2UEM6_9MICO
MAIEKWVVNPGETRVIDLELVRKLKVGLIGGKVDVIAHDEPGARVEVSSVTGKDLMIQIDGDALEIDHAQLRWDNFLEVFKGFRGSAKAEVSILAPRHVAMKLGVVSGDALVSGFDDDGRFSSVSGELVIDNHAGDIECSTVSGEVSVGDHTGKVVAHTVSGDVTVTGDIHAFKADTVSGDMIVDSRGTPGRIDTNTVSGDLTVRFDAGSGARYRVNTVSGSLLLDDTQIKGTLGKGFERVTGELEGTWLDLGANSVSGNISVIRRQPASAAANATGESTDAAGAAAHDADASHGPAGEASA